MILPYDVWIDEFMNPYFDKIQMKLDSGKIGHKKYYKSLDKLSEWEQHHVEKFGYNYYDPEEEI